MVKQSILERVGMSQTTTGMTKESLAAELNGREYGSEITDAEETAARAAGLVVVFGYSDDNVELRGAIRDELSCYDEGEFFVTRKGVQMKPDSDERKVLERFGVLDEVLARKGAKIETLWCKEKDYSWTYKMTVPHATFDIIEDGEKFCRGIVFSLEDVP